MRVLFFCGWTLVAAAFVLAALESQALLDANWNMLSADQLWYAMAPDGYANAKHWTAANAPWLWSPVLSGILWFPAWLIAGGPGVAMIWFGWRGRRPGPEAMAAYKEREESLFLFDELAADARQWAHREGQDPDADDQLPSHEMHETLAEEPGITHALSIEASLYDRPPPDDK
jgi:hypothetical protein